MPKSVDLLPLSRHPVAHPSGGKTSLYLVRHGRTLGNVQRVLCGWTDLPLDELGEQQAELVGARMADGSPVDVLLSSPLQRAQATARAIGDRMGLTPVIRPNLIEWNFGSGEGLSFEAMATRFPDLAARFMDIEDFDVGWPEGETRREFHDRVYAEFLQILRDYPDKRVIVVAHGGVFGSLLAQVQGNQPNDWRSYDIQNCSVTHLEVELEGTAVHLLNDVEHLSSLAAALAEDDES